MSGDETEKKQVGTADYDTPYTAMPIQPWQIIDALGLNFYEGNVLKYLLRRKTGQRVQDLEKAIHYLEHLIELERTTADTGSNFEPISGSGSVPEKLLETISVRRNQGMDTIQQNLDLALCPAKELENKIK